MPPSPSPPQERVEKGVHPRRTPPQTKPHPRNQQLRIDIPTLHQHPQAHRDNRISQPTNPPHAQPVRDNAPDRTRNQRHQLVRKAQGPNQISHSVFDAEQVGDDEGDAGVQEDEEGDAEEAGAEEVGGCLEGGDAGREREVAG